MKHRITVVVESAYTKAKVTARYETEDELWHGGQMQLHDALDAAYGPAVVADAIAERESGVTF
jgi:hypothetical protein